MVRRRAINFALLLAVLICFTTTAGASNLTATLKTTYFAVHYEPQASYQAEAIADTAQQELHRIAKDLGYTLERNRPIPLTIYRTHYDFIQADGLRDRFTVGITRTGDEAIAVDASGAFVKVQEILAHEITHAVIFRMLGSNISALPLWANEGLAKYESQDYTEPDDTLVADAAANYALLALSDLKTKFPEDKTALAYAESASVIRYMIKHHGKKSPEILLKELAKTGSFDRALIKATGMSQTQLALSWGGSLSNEFWLLRFGRIIGAIGGVLMAILAALAFIVRRRQMKKAAEEWEWEQFEERMRRGFEDYHR